MMNNEMEYFSFGWVGVQYGFCITINIMDSLAILECA
jgi:hypothetical protein